MTGRIIDWRLLFELNVVSTTILYWPEIFKYIFILLSQLLLGIALYIVGHSFVRKVLNSCYLRIVYDRCILASVVFGLCLAYSTIIIFYPPTYSWQEPSSNAVLDLIPATVKYYTRMENTLQLSWEKSEINTIEQFIRAPGVQISQPSTVLNKPIKHIFLIILESIRADVVPLSDQFATAIRSKFRANLTADDVAPFLSSLWKHSVRTNATTVASYTLKSLIGTLCGIYPLNVDFLEEANSKNKFYEVCLPDLLRKTFRNSKNQSTFRSAFFTAARDGFDRQRELIKRMQFDNVYNGFDVVERMGPMPDVGTFGPADSTILPLLWDWIDNNSDENQKLQLLTSLLMTGTHDPFDMPPSESIYRDYIEDKRANSYLNAIRVTDSVLKSIADGLKVRGLYNETLIVIVSDHGYAFRDWGRKSLATWRVSYECGFSIPLMLHNPNLEPKQLNEQYTNMDILPTIMDVLLSSHKTTYEPTNYLLSIRPDQLESILLRYEGTSLLRRINKHEIQRYTFHIDNPGNSHIIVKQYPRKLVYDVHYDIVHLFHLEYDPQESIDLILLDHQDHMATKYPDWLMIDHNRNSFHNWSRRWVSSKNSLSHDHKKTLCKNVSQSMLDIKQNTNRISLKDMLEWADASLELANVWATLVRLRYFYGNTTIHH